MASPKHIDDLPDELLVKIFWSSDGPISNQSGDDVVWDALPTETKFSYAIQDEPRYQQSNTPIPTPPIPPAIADAAYNLLIASICRRWRRLAKLHVSTLLVKEGRSAPREGFSAAVACFPNLTHLHLCDSSLEVLDDAFLAHLAASCPKLTTFHIGKENALETGYAEGEEPLTDAGWDHFFRRCTQLEHLSLNGLPVETGLPNSFFQLVRLRSLVISDPPGLWSTDFRNLSSITALSTDMSLNLEELSDLVHLTGLTSLSFGEELKVFPGNRPSGPFCFAQLTLLKSLQVGSGCPPFTVMFPTESPCSCLERLVVGGCEELEFLPEQIREMFPCLRELTVKDCQDLMMLPEEFSSLRCLQKLELSECQLLNLPATFGYLLVLKTLLLDRLPLSHLPSSFCQLKSLETLLVSGCPYLEDLPTGFTNLTALKSLSFKSSTTLVLPEDLGEMTNLQALTLESYHGQQLPSSFTQLASLTRLELDQCRIDVLPEAMGQLRNLRELQIRSCPIQKLPNSVSTLVSLKILRIVMCSRLGRVPIQFAGLTRLEQLELSGCQLLLEFAEALPSSLETLRLYSLQQVTGLPATSELPRLKNLILEIESFLCDLVRSLHSLERLDLVVGPDADLSFLVTSLPRLQSLTIASSQNVRLPEFSTSALQQLRQLDLTIADLTDIPLTISGLQKLTLLAINAPKLTALPDSIGMLSRLCSLTLSDCAALTQLLASLTQLACLQRLYIRNASIRALPAGFAHLTRLQGLELSDCKQLEALPEEITKLKLLRRLTACGCDLVRDAYGNFHIPGVSRLMYRWWT